MQRLDVLLRKEMKIVNVVCTADLKQCVNIASFNKYKFLSSNLDLYSCGYVKNDTMIGRVTVFASGKLISVGTKSPKQAKDELEKACKILKQYKLINSYKIDPQIRNMVSSAFLGKTVSLNKLARTLPRSMYEPEQFPGLIYKIQNSVTALIFASGKIIVAGAKTFSELNNAFYEISNRIN